MATYILHRRGTAAHWTASNPVLFSAELGYEKDTGKWKWGDGVTDWNTLPYIEGGGGSVTDATNVIKGSIRLGHHLGGTAENPTVVSGAGHTHTAEQVSNASAIGLSLMKAASSTIARDAISVGPKAETAGWQYHDGTAGGGTRLSGYQLVIWLGGSTRPTNMAANDLWWSF